MTATPPNDSLPYKFTREYRTTPFRFMFGKEAHLPIYAMFGFPPGKVSVSPSHYALFLRQRMEVAYHRFTLKCSCDNVNKWMTRKWKGAPICVGDLVWLYSRAVAWGSCQKLHRPWQGPSKIVKVINNAIHPVQQMKQPWCSVVHHDVSNHTVNNLKVAL